MDVVVKLITVSIFAILLYWIIDYVVGLIGTMVDMGTLMPTVKYFMCRLGIFHALNIIISFLIASWFAEKILRYLG